MSMKAHCLIQCDSLKVQVACLVLEWSNRTISLSVQRLPLWFRSC